MYKINKNFKSDDTIYICSGLGKFPNINNRLLLELEKQFPNIKESSKITIPAYKDLKGRELYAIVDYIIAQGSSFFLGHGLSTFSILLSYTIKKSVIIKLQQYESLYEAT